MTLVIQYSVVPRTITTNSPYPYGGMFHAETIREACLAAAESDTDDQVGLHQQLYEQKLKASIAFDIDQSVADFLGYNGDGTRCYRSRLGLTLNVNNINVSTPLPGNGGHSSSGEQNMANEVFHDFITRSAFNSMSKNDNWLYFVSETDGTINLYKGNTLVSQAVTLVSSFPSVGETGRLYLCLSPLALKTWAGEWKTLLPAASGQAGKSAYEIWLDNGHTGTEADFLASLHGQAPTLTVNSCTTLDPGQPAFFRITGTSPNLFVDVGIPKGDTTQGDLSSPTVELYVSQFGENITSYLPQLSDGNYHYLTLDANCIDYPSILTPVISDFSTTLVVEIYDNRTEGNRGISVKGHNFDHIAGRNWLITFWNGGNGVCATVDQIYR